MQGIFEKNVFILGITGQVAPTLENQPRKCDISSIIDGVLFSLEFFKERSVEEYRNFAVR